MSKDKSENDEQESETSIYPKNANFIENSPDSTQNNAYDKKEISIQSGRCINFINGKWFNPIVLITLVYTIFAGLQWWTMNGQLNIIKQYNRPWLSVSLKNMTGFEIDKFINVTLQVTNAGETPSINTRQYFSMGFREKPVPDPMPKIDWNSGDKSTGQIVPDDSKLLETEPGHEIKFTHESSQMYDSGKYRFYIWGEIFYEDTFHNPCYTRFCFYIKKGMNTPVFCENNNTMK